MKRQSILTRLCGVTFQKTAIFIIDAMRTRKLTCRYLLGRITVFCVYRLLGVVQNCSFEHVGESSLIKGSSGVLPIMIQLSSSWEKPRFHRTTSNMGSTTAVCCRWGCDLDVLKCSEIQDEICLAVICLPLF